MAKPTIVTRASKGSALTWTEGDTNLENLRDATIGITDGTTSGTLDLNDTLAFTAGSNVTLSYNSTSKALTINAAGGSGITDVVQDTTPQLGGNLDVNGQSIVSVSNGNIAITPDGTGSIVLDGLNWPQADGTSGQVLQTNGSGQLSWATAGGGTPTQVDFTATPSSTDVYFVTTSAAGAGAKDLYAVNNGGLKFNTGSGVITTDVNLTLNGGNLMVRAGGNVRLYDNDDSNAAILVGPASLTASTLFRLPDSNGTSGQFLQTDGTGVTSWASAGTGTVTSVSGAGTVNGLTLTGTVTSSGSLTLGGTLSLATAPAIGSTSANTGTFTTLTVNAANDLRLADSDSSNYVGFKAPATVSANKIWTLPAADGTSGQVLSTNGSGTLSWATAGGGSGPSFALISLGSPQGQLISGNDYRTTLTELLDASNIVSYPTTYQFQLGAGTYIIEFSASYVNSPESTNNQVKIYNETGAADFMTSLVMSGPTGSNKLICGSAIKNVTLASNTAFSVRAINALSYNFISSFQNGTIKITKTA
jgi:hypothetical protein